MIDLLLWERKAIFCRKWPVFCSILPDVEATRCGMGQMSQWVWYVENPRRGRQGRNFTTNVPKNSRSQIVFLTDIFRKLTLGVLEYYSDLFSMTPKARSSKVRKFIIIIIIIIILFIIIGYSSCLYILREWRECCHQHALWFLQFIIYKIFFSGRFPFCLPHYDARTRISIMTGFNLHKHGALKNKKMEKLLFYDF